MDDPLTLPLGGLMKQLLVLIGLFLSQSALAVTPSETDVQYLLNHFSNGAAQKVQLGDQVIGRKKLMLKCNYLFSRDGGAVSTIALKDVLTGKDCKLPNKAIIHDVLFDAYTAVTSGGSATVAFTTGQNSGDLKAATAKASWTGLVAGVPVGTAATSVKLTAERTISAVVATAALTAGKINVFIEYFLSDT
jgi:hypothetical protein